MGGSRSSSAVVAAAAAAARWALILPLWGVEGGPWLWLGEDPLRRVWGRRLVVVVEGRGSRGVGFVWAGEEGPAAGAAGGRRCLWEQVQQGQPQAGLVYTGCLEWSSVEGQRGLSGSLCLQSGE